MNIKKKQVKYFNMKESFLEKLEEIKKENDMSYTDIIEFAILEINQDDINNIESENRQMRSYYLGKDTLMHINKLKTFDKRLSAQKIIEMGINKIYKK